MTTVFLNGQFMPIAEAKVPVMDRGFLFGDGACAAVLGPCEPGQGLLAFRMDTIGEAAPLLAVPGGGSCIRMTLPDPQTLLPA